MQSPNASIPPCGAPPSWRAGGAAADRTCGAVGRAAGWRLADGQPGRTAVSASRRGRDPPAAPGPVPAGDTASDRAGAAPHAPNIVSWMSWRLDPRQLLWVCPEKPADALWAAEQILRNGSCGALLCWLPQVRPESLRRLHLAAQASDLLFVALRPSAAAAHATPAPCGWRWRPRRADCPSISSSAGACLRYAAARGPGARRLRNTRPPCASGSPPACAACRWTPYARTGLTTPRRTPCWSRSA